MNVEDIVKQIEAEIERLKKVKELLAGSETLGQLARSEPKRTMSLETRKKIAAAQRRSWAEGRNKGRR